MFRVGKPILGQPLVRRKKETAGASSEPRSAITQVPAHESRKAKWQVGKGGLPSMIQVHSPLTTNDIERCRPSQPANFRPLNGIRREQRPVTPARLR